MSSDPRSQSTRNEFAGGPPPSYDRLHKARTENDTKTVLGADSVAGPDVSGSPTPVGKAIGKYEIRSQLGSGGMGAVYLAFDKMLEREVAIKVLSQEVASSKTALQRFLQEARAIGRLNHPNVVSLHDIDLWNGQYYIVMEYLSGGSLAEMVQTYGPSHWRVACKMIAQAAAGLAAAHAAGMVHRDIKPENLMKTREGLVKVVDFGLTKLVDAAHDTRTAMTKQGQILGTPQYMSPEQFESSEVDLRTDIYSLGASLFRLLTGRFPYEECSSIVQTMMAHLNKPAPKATEFVRHLPIECNHIIAKAMSKQPADRYQTATEMADALMDVIEKGGSHISALTKTPVFTPSPVQQTERASITVSDEVRRLRSVVIIEPSKMLATMMRDTCARSGAFRIDLYSTKQQVIAAMQNHVPDLLMTAMELPDGKGIDLISELSMRCSLNRTCVVLNSSDSTVEDLVAAGTAASLVLAPKRVRPEDTLRIVHAAGPCELEQGIIGAQIDATRFRLVIMSDYKRVPDSVAELIRQTGLLDVVFVGLNDSERIPISETPTVVLRLWELTKATQRDFRDSIFMRLLPDSRHILAEVDVDQRRLYLRALFRQSVIASVHRILDAHRLKCLLQACRAS
ncbi:serine/threonine protein kinase [Schlesneria sp. DSM 10557]|uniref:serine/threonine protein kinase n=1 Tax=Schlesneria sp. DSM 10557 TaxID=3044399 RepID=UPI00359FA5C5